MIDLGNIPANSTLYIPFCTYGKTNGESITLTGLATSDILVFKNGSTTQRSSTAGFTLLDTDGIDFDSITGLHGFSIDLSDNTDAGFYSVGGFYWVVVSTVTVDSSVVTFIAATFRIVTAEAVAGRPVIDVGSISGDSTAADNAESFFDGTGYAGTNNVIPTVTTTTNLTNKGDGSGFTAVPWNAAWDSEVQSEVDDALVAQNLDHLVKIAVDTDIPTTVHLNSVIGYMMDNGTAWSYDRTTDAMEVPPSVTLTAGDIADIADAIATALSGVTVNIVSPVGDGGTIQITSGDTYNSTNGQTISWQNTSWPTLTGATAKFYYIESGTETSITCSVDTGTKTVTMDLTATQTTAIVRSTGTPWSLRFEWLSESPVRYKTVLNNTMRVTSKYGL